ncbi:MAG: hypothetical protein AAB963_00445 [Patescibacteria group bacterium]
MKTELEKLNELEETRKITIGVDRGRANNFWAHQTTTGKILNLLTPVFIIFSVFIFIKFDFWKGVLAIAVIGVYVVIIQNIACMYVRKHILQNKKFFDQVYQTKSITIRDNSTNKIVSYPTDWKKEISSI